MWLSVFWSPCDKGASVNLIGAISRVVLALIALVAAFFSGSFFGSSYSVSGYPASNISLSAAKNLAADGEKNWDNVIFHFRVPVSGEYVVGVCEYGAPIYLLVGGSEEAPDVLDLRTLDAQDGVDAVVDAGATCGNSRQNNFWGFYNKARLNSDGNKAHRVKELMLELQDAMEVAIGDNLAESRWKWKAEEEQGDNK
jgi:hypothetical protein